MAGFDRATIGLLLLWRSCEPSRMTSADRVCVDRVLVQASSWVVDGARAGEIAAESPSTGLQAVSRVAIVSLTLITHSLVHNVENASRVRIGKKMKSINLNTCLQIVFFFFHGIPLVLIRDKNFICTRR